MKTRRACWVIGFTAFAAITSSPRRAEARACTEASNCPMGFTCEPGGVATDGGSAGTCVSLPCQSNSDCGPGLSCYLDMETVCQTAADGGTACGASSVCVPQWDAPCVTATDCGSGFTCPRAMAGSYNCGKDQDASEPPYAIVTIIPCSAVPTPPNLFGDAGPPLGFPASLSICEAGTTCTSVTWNTCVAQQTGACTVDSDCPSTWTCGCQANCGGTLSLGEPALDASCTMACVPPNSDLIVEECAGGAEAPSLGPSGSTPAPSSPGASDSGGGVEATGPSGSPATAGSSSGQAGCQIGSDGTSATWALAAAGLLAATRRRTRRRSP